MPRGARWEKPLQFEPGHWKKQLPTRYLKLAERGDTKALRALIDEHPEFLNRRGSHGRTLLFEAVRRGREDALRWLIDAGADIHATGCYNIETLVQLNPLTAARWYGHSDIAGLLLELGASNDVFRAAFSNEAAAVDDALAEDPALVHAEDPEDEIHYTPLISFAVAGGHDGLARRLIERGAAVQPYGLQLLFIAAKESRRHLIELLLASGANPADADARLWMATRDLDLLSTLIAHGLSANARDYRGLRPLAYAARGDKGQHPEKIALMLRHGAEVDGRGLHGRTALHYAAAAGFDEVVDLLLAAGADPLLRDEKDRTARDLAVAKKRPSTAALLTARLLKS